MVAINVCCKKVTFKNYMECPDHNPSKESLEKSLATSSERVRELTEALEKILIDGNNTKKDSFERVFYMRKIAKEALTKDTTTNSTLNPQSTNPSREEA